MMAQGGAVFHPSLPLGTWSDLCSTGQYDTERERQFELSDIA
jgi:hypothetical protein